MSRYMTREADDEDVADQDGDGDDGDDDDDTETDDDDEPPSGKNPHGSEVERIHNIAKQNGQH